jgi:TfoX/Sxy family transcriptional regulator of competence genes
MAYDEGLSVRIDELLVRRADIEVKKMFGGLCYLSRGHMLCGVLQDTLMARVGPDQYADCLEREHAREMDFTGKAMKGMIYVSPEGIESDEDLLNWIDTCFAFVDTLPPKPAKKK